MLMLHTPVAHFNQPRDVFFVLIFVGVVFDVVKESACADVRHYSYYYSLSIYVIRSFVSQIEIQTKVFQEAHCSLTSKTSLVVIFWYHMRTERYGQVNMSILYKRGTGNNVC